MMFEALKEYKKDHRDCNVPSNWPKDKQLANWIRRQRYNYLNRKLSNDRIKCLESIGFVWRE